MTTFANEYRIQLPLHASDDSEGISSDLIVLLQFIQGILMLWKGLKASDLSMKRLGAAMTNTVYILSNEHAKAEEPQKMLLRVYGEGVENILNREQELAWFSKLSDLGVGPKLIATFQNGRLEEYIDSITLTPDLMREGSVSTAIAASMSRFHKTIERNQEQVRTPIMWGRLENWKSLASIAFGYPSSASPNPVIERLHKIGVFDSEFEDQIITCRDRLIRLDSPIVFSHNDLQHGNILLTRADNQIVLIDYEYGGVNYAAFDIANHFCEWASDFTESNSTPEIMDFAGKYPSVEEQQVFLYSYLTHFYQKMPTKELVSEWHATVEEFRVMSNIIWGYWAVIQAANSNIDFKYLDYAVCRFEEAVRLMQGK